MGRYRTRTGDPTPGMCASLSATVLTAGWLDIGSLMIRRCGKCSGYLATNDTREL